MNLGNELNNLDLETLVGAPLSAMINAQAQSSIATVDFIKTIGFDETNGNTPRTVTFNYQKPVENSDGTKTQQDYTMTAPLVTFMPVPVLRIEKATINFNAKINSVQEVTESSDTSTSLKKKVRLNMSYSSQQKNQSVTKTDQAYSMNIEVEVGPDEIPPGIETLMDSLETSIKEEPLGTEKLTAETDISLASGVRIMDTKL